MTKKIKKKQVPKLYWHIHHRVLLEALTFPLKERIRCIKYDKEKCERRVRLACLKPVKRPDLLPKVVRQELETAYYKSPTRGHWFKLYGKGRYTHAGRVTIGPVFRRIMARHRKEYPNCTCDAWGCLVF